MHTTPTFDDVLQHLHEADRNPVPAAPSPLPPSEDEALPVAPAPQPSEVDWATATADQLLALGVPEGPLAAMRFDGWRRHMVGFSRLTPAQKSAYNRLASASRRALRALTEGERRAYELRNSVRDSGGDVAFVDPREFETHADRELRLQSHLRDGTDPTPPTDYAGRRDPEAQRERAFYARDKATLADMRRRARAEAKRTSAERRAAEKAAERMARQCPDTPQGRVARATVIALAGERERAKSWGAQAHDDAWAIQLQGRVTPRALRHPLLTTPLPQRTARFHHNRGV